MVLLQTPSFKKAVQKLHKNQVVELEAAIKLIVQDPYIGEAKKGDLAGVRVYKLRIISHLTLIAYQINNIEHQIILLSCGSHENFYRDLKKE